MESNAQFGAMCCPKGTDVATVSGRFVDVLHPDPETICIEDIAHHLSMISRYGGATDRFYSVAEHSVRVLQLLHYLSDHPGSRREILLAALLHDGAEAYLQDMVSPVKFAMRIEEMEALVGRLEQPYEDHAVLKNWRGTYGKLCDRMDRAIGAALGIRPELFDAPQVRLCDMWALRIEAREMLPSNTVWRWPDDLPLEGMPPDEFDSLWSSSMGWSQQKAKDEFIHTYYEFAGTL